MAAATLWLSGCEGKSTEAGRFLGGCGWLQGWSKWGRRGWRNERAQGGNEGMCWRSAGWAVIQAVRQLGPPYPGEWQRHAARCENCSQALQGRSVGETIKPDLSLHSEASHRNKCTSMEKKSCSFPCTHMRLCLCLWCVYTAFSLWWWRSHLGDVLLIFRKRNPAARILELFFFNS